MQALSLATISFAILLANLPAAAQQHVTYSAPDGARLKADLYGHGKRGVVLAHGGRFNKESWRKQAEVLTQSGFLAMAIDFRGFGQSLPNSHDADWGKYLDVLGAVRYLHKHGAKTVSIIGASMGGTAAGEAAAAAKPGEIESLVLLGSEGGDAPERLRCRKLFILSRDDFSGDGPRLPGIRQHYDRSPEPKRLVILEGSAHAQFIFDTPQSDRLMREILQFLLN